MLPAMATLDKIKVAVRVRPFNKRELALGSSQTRSVVQMKNNQTILQSPDQEEFSKHPKSFTFDHCFHSLDPKSPDFASQADVFQSVGTDILDNAFRGYNACIFAYGQTGSGKSYTMLGSEDQPGIIPRLCVSLFERIGGSDARSGGALDAKVEVSYMEIYNEKVFDLLDLTSNKSGLKVREHHLLGPYVDGLSKLAVTSFKVSRFIFKLSPVSVTIQTEN